MTSEVNSYISTLVDQIGFEKRTFDSTLNMSVTIAAAALGAAIGFFGTQRFELVFSISVISSLALLALFLRAVRAYCNYYLYMLLKNEFVRVKFVPQINDEYLVNLVTAIDLRRSWEGRRLALKPSKLRELRLLLKVASRTEYFFAIPCFLFLEIFSATALCMPLSVLLGVLLQLFVGWWMLIRMLPPRKSLSSELCDLLSEPSRPEHEQNARDGSRG